MRTKNLSKQALDTIIRKSRVHLYKPIQIAEILFHHRTERGWDLNDLESYRNISKRWRDDVSSLLVGRRSTSSQKYQDNIFEANAMPPGLLAKLGIMNKKGRGIVEAYVYKALEARLLSVREIESYIKTSTANAFSIMKLVSLFQTTPGLRRSIDKMYEILVYALFATIVRALKAQITLEIGNKDTEILKDFEQFIKMVLGVDAKQTKLIMPAALYRVGVTNAADRGLDMWTNFGPAVQVKHLTLTAELMEDIADNITADKIVIACVDTEKEAIESLLKQVGWSERIQGIITIADLDEWYKLCLSKKYRDNLGANLLKDVQREFDAEFPSSKEIKPFMAGRKYDKIALPPDWQIQI
ncbi:HaeII family restriction endonuclease [Candidatus Peregrinibacteria bacterium]|nr:HaeII family restriction endonuclease [Candidatus Peregrinibacteria bacterium]